MDITITVLMFVQSTGGLPGLSATSGKTGLLTSVATTTSSGGLTGSGGGGGVKQYTYKELEDLINKVVTCNLPVSTFKVKFPNNSDIHCCSL